MVCFKSSNTFYVELLLLPQRTEIVSSSFTLLLGEAVKNDEAYGIALPLELLEEFQAYIERNGMLEHARRLINEEEPVGNDEHRLDKLNNGMTWGCKCIYNMNIHHKTSSI